MKLTISWISLVIFLLPGPGLVLAQTALLRGNIQAVEVQSEDAKEGKEKKSGETSILPQPDRETLKRLKDAQHLITKERFGEAVRILGDILSSPDDSFFPTDDPKKQGVTKIRGLREEAEQILGTLPRRAMELYELQFGSQANQLLKQAMREGDTRAPADISRRFFYTQAGVEATWLSGLAAMDEGRWKAAILALGRLEKQPLAARHYDPLLTILKAVCLEQTEQHDLAQKAWNLLRERALKASMQIAGEAVPLFHDKEETFSKFLERTNLKELDRSGDLLSTLVTDQLLPQGTPQRNPSVDAGLPLLKRVWRARITDRPTVETMLQKQREVCIDSGTLAIPRFYPLVVDGVLYSRTLRTLIAVDTTTGKRLWEANLKAATENEQAELAIQRSQSNFFQSQVNQIWWNSIFGQLSSDRRNIYAIEDIDSNLSNQAGMGRIIIQGAVVAVPGIMPGTSQTQGPSNVLVAFDAKTGQQRWNRSTGPNDAPLFFLGPPLPMDGLLYALAQGQGEIHLVVVSAASGELEWSQRMVVVEQANSPYTNSTAMNAMVPAASDGVMVCPTGNGAIVAIEPTTRALLWAHCYEQLGRNQSRVRIINGVVCQPNQDHIAEELMIHDGRVFSAPIDSSYLYCLDLNTGEELWKKNFSEGAFFGGIYKDRLLVIGGRKFQTFNTKDGKEIDSCELNKSLEQEDAVLITGRGFRNEGVYYAPTSSRHIVAFDIEQGKMVQQTGTRKPIILGNLVAVGDRVYSQSLDGLEAFHQLKVIRAKTEEQLQKNPNDLAAIAMQGELLLAEDKLAEAIEKFRHVYKAQPSPASGDPLFEALSIGLEEAYAEYRELRPEIESLLRTPLQKNRYWYYVVRGEIQENRLDVAADACFRLAELSGQSDEILSMDRYHTVRQDRFVQAQLVNIYEGLDEAGQAKLAQKILAHFNAALKSGSRSAIYEAWNCYASLPPIEERYEEIIDKVWDLDPVFTELILENTIRFGEPGEAATAMIHWAELLRKSGRMEDAAACYRTAIYRWKEVPLAGSTQTAYAKLLAMPAEDPVRNLLAKKEVWPAGHVVEKSTKKESQSFSPFESIHMQSRMFPLGTESPIFRNKKIFLCAQQVQLKDEYNRVIWTLSLVDEEEMHHTYYNHYQTRCSTAGHMIFLELQDKLVAIDAWDPKQPKIVWQTERNANVNVPGVRTTSSNFQRRYFSGYTQGMYGNNQRMLGVPGLDFGFQLLTVEGTELVALDPLEGVAVWKHRKLPNQIDFNSDGTIVQVSPPNHRQGAAPLVMRLVDGSRVEPNKKQTESTSKTKKPTAPQKVPNKPKNQKEKEEMARKAGELAAKLFMKSGNRHTNPPQKILSCGQNMLAYNRVSSKHSFAMMNCITYKPVWQPKNYSNGSHWGLLGRDYLGVIDSRGRLEVFRISDGKTIVQRTLKLDGTLQGIYLQNLGDCLAVTISTTPKSSNQSFGSSYLPITHYMTQGRVHLFHWDGEPAMTKKVDGVSFEQMGILADPPEKLPVIVLMSQIYNDNNQNKPWTTKFQMLDSRTGEEILAKQFDESIQSFDLTGDPEKKTIECEINDEKFMVRFK